MAPTDTQVRTTPATALPSVTARLIAVLAIILAGLCGGLIGWAFADLQIDNNDVLPRAAASLVGAVTCALGTAVVAVLVLRAMGEWHLSTIEAESVERTRRR